MPRRIGVQFVERDGYRVELIAPLDAPDTPSPVTGLLDQIGPTAYHLAYAVEAVEVEIGCLVLHAFRLIEPPSAGPAVDDRPAAFLIHPATGLLELFGPAPAR